MDHRLIPRPGLAGFSAGREGVLTFLDPAATRDHRSALAEGPNQILEYKLAGDGGLTETGQEGSIPAWAAGLLPSDLKPIAGAATDNCPRGNPP